MHYSDFQVFGLKKKFSANFGFEKMRNNENIITGALQLLLWKTVTLQITMK